MCLSEKKVYFKLLILTNHKFMDFLHVIRVENEIETKLLDHIQSELKRRLVGAGII